jgi:hypothetical protein
LDFCVSNRLGVGTQVLEAHTLSFGNSRAVFLVRLALMTFDVRRPKVRVAVILGQRVGDDVLDLPRLCNADPAMADVANSEMRIEDAGTVFLCE